MCRKRFERHWERHTLFTRKRCENRYKVSDVKFVAIPRQSTKLFDQSAIPYLTLRELSGFARRVVEIKDISINLANDYDINVIDKIMMHSRYRVLIQRSAFLLCNRRVRMKSAVFSGWESEDAGKISLAFTYRLSVGSPLTENSIRYFIRSSFPSSFSSRIRRARTIYITRKEFTLSVRGRAIRESDVRV